MPWILRFATGRRTLAAVGIWLAGNGVLFSTGPFPRVKAVAPGGMLPEEQLGVTPEMLAQFLDFIGPESRADYILFQQLDILVPLLMGGAGALVMAWLLRRSGVTAGWAVRLPVVLPLLLLVTEVVEDFVLARAAQLYPAASALTPALPVLTAAKFATILLIGAVIVVYGCRLAIGGRSRPGAGGAG